MSTGCGFPTTASRRERGKRRHPGQRPTPASPTPPPTETPPPTSSANKPDLVVSQLSTSGPPIVGQSVQVYATVKNQGPAYSTGYFLTRLRRNSTAVQPVMENTRGRPPGRAETYTRNWT